MDSGTPPRQLEDGLRDPTDFEDDISELSNPPVSEREAVIRPPRSILHRRSGTGTNMSASSISTKKTAIGLGRRTLGLLLMLVTITMWTVSNFLASSIFADDTYSKPFFVTYLNVGFFTCFLIGPLTKSALGRLGMFPSWTRQRTAEPIYSSLATSSALHPTKPDDDDEDFAHSISTSTQSPRESLLLDESMVLPSHGFGPSPSTPSKLTFRETARLALEFCPLWFASNYFIAACLQYTTVASSTVISATSSVFTLAFGVLFGVESFTFRKLLSVGVCLLGVVLISQVDLSGQNDENRGSFPEKSAAEMAIGDVLALASAMGYGLYTILLKKRIQDESRMDVFVFFGFIGVWDLLLLWPGLAILHWTGIETFEIPSTGKVWWVIMATGAVSLISDVSWTYSMLLTSPLVITVGLSLGIPISILGQMVINGQNSSLLYWLGSVVVAVSFFIVNQESKREAEVADKAIVEAVVPPVIVVEDGEEDDEDEDEGEEGGAPSYEGR